MVAFVNFWRQNFLMSKKFKEKTCVYCAENISEGADHVFAREFFLEKHRENLPKVPSCNPCNNSKSRLETYLLGILPFGAQHKDATTHLKEKVPRRLKKNQKLRRSILKGQQTKWVRNDKGLIVQAKSLPFEPDKLVALAKFFVKGLMWHHWGALISPHPDMEVMILTKVGEEVFQNQFLGLNVNASVDENLGDGTVAYQGLQCIDNHSCAVWRFKIFEGIEVSRNVGTHTKSNCIIGVILLPGKK